MSKINPAQQKLVSESGHMEFCQIIPEKGEKASASLESVTPIKSNNVHGCSMNDDMHPFERMLD